MKKFGCSSLIFQMNVWENDTWVCPNLKRDWDTQTQGVSILSFMFLPLGAWACRLGKGIVASAFLPLPSVGWELMKGMVLITELPPSCTPPCPRELCVIWGTCDTMWKRLLQCVRKDRRRPGTVLAWLTRFGSYVETTPNSKITWPVLR